MERDEILQRIANHLIMNTCYISDQGLFHGKMGIILFFVHYSKYTNKMIYDEFGQDLLDDICDNLDSNLSVYFESGLSGIGWGILYLIENGFLEGDPNVILKEIDRKIVEMNLLKISNYSLSNGLNGILLYLKKRFTYGIDESIYDDAYMDNFQETIARQNSKSTFDLQRLVSLNYCSVNFENMNKSACGLNGCAGYGLNMILK